MEPTDEALREARTFIELWHLPQHKTTNLALLLDRFAAQRGGAMIENLQSDADNDGTYIAAMKSAQQQICEAIGVERGRDHWPEFMARVRERVKGLPQTGTD